MSSFTPYRCLHLPMEQRLEWNNIHHKQYGIYYVLWWKHTPLGHLFIKPEETLSQEKLESKILHAILPALQHYTQNTSLRLQDFHDVAQHCSALFPDENIPETCNASVVICTKDRAESLRNCLQSIQNLRCKPAEIIVVDNATRDDSTRKVAAEFRDVIYVREDRPGLDIARNTGAKTASKPIIIYTDDDTLIHPLWVYHTVKTFDDPQVSAMTGLVLAHQLDTEAQWIFERFWPFNRGFKDIRYDNKFFADTMAKGSPVWNIGAGANMAFRKQVFDTSGYFDERLDVGAAGCSGDSEIWYRILANGGTIQYNPRAIVSHYHREAMDKLQQQIFAYMRGFTAAILIQHQRFRHKGNLKHLFIEIPKYYCYLTARGFPRYRGRYKTVFAEMRGLFSGLIFYLKNRKTPSNIK